MKILAIGDPHGNIGKIKQIDFSGIDIILITGDFEKADLVRKRFFENIKRLEDGLPAIKYDAKFSKQVAKQMYNSSVEIIKYLTRLAPVYSISGNVWMSDSWAKKEEKRLNVKLPRLHEYFKKKKNFNLVRNTTRRLHKKKIGFLEYFIDTNWVEDFKPKNYEKSMQKAMKETAKANRVLERFKKVDILVCHQPPYGYLDKVTDNFAPENYKGKNAGSKTILNYIQKYQPKYVFCGHIHEGEGLAKIGTTKVYNLGVAGHKIIEI